MILVGLVTSLDGCRRVRAVASGAPTDARALGGMVAKDLLAQGAEEILAEVNQGPA
jgi:porphobilinogen deaminase